MSKTRVVCCKCGKPLDHIPAYLAEGNGANLFECDDCFYPGCENPSLVGGRGGLRSRLDSLVENLDSELQTADT